MNAWSLWIVAGLLALLSLGQTLWLALETHTGVAVHGLPHDLCREVTTCGRMSVAEAARIYNTCRNEAGVRSEALCSQVVKGYLSIGEASQLYRAFPMMSEWEWKQLRPLSACHMLDSRCQDWDWKALLAGRIWIGMTDTQVMVAWGPPVRMTRTTTTFEVRELWVYEGGVLDSTRILSFRGGVLTSVEMRRG